MLLNLDFKFKDLDEKEIAGDSAAQIVSSILAKEKLEMDCIDAYEFAKELRKIGEINIKPTDIDLLEKAIRSSDNVAPFAKAQIILAIKSAKENKQAEPA